MVLVTCSWIINFSTILYCFQQYNCHSHFQVYFNFIHIHVFAATSVVTLSTPVTTTRPKIELNHIGPRKPKNLSIYRSYLYPNIPFNLHIFSIVSTIDTNGQPSAANVARARSADAHKAQSTSRVRTHLHHTRGGDLPHTYRR